MTYIKCTAVLVLVIVYHIKLIHMSVQQARLSRSNLPREKICNRYCECKSKETEYMIKYEEIVCNSWEKFIQLGSDPGFYSKDTAFRRIWMYIHDNDRNGIEFIDVKDHPHEESMISENQQLKTLLISQRLLASRVPHFWKFQRSVP